MLIARPTALTIPSRLGGAIANLHLEAEISEVVISNLKRNHRVRVCQAAVEVPAEGSLPELGPGVRSVPYP